MSNELSEAARAMGRKGGASKSPAKQRASRENGKRLREIIEKAANRKPEPAPGVPVVNDLESC